jgi:hypothetical protein
MTELKISKVLSANDTGETGGHQAGLLVPREERILSFFPPLDGNQLNPRSHLHFEDQDGSFWEFAFIYYNNRFFGGTRNEYRLTCMTKYIRQAGLTAGDEVVLRYLGDAGYFISFERANLSLEDEEGKTVIRLGSGWKVIDI